MIHAMYFPFTFELAQALPPDERAREIEAVCKLMDSLCDQGRPDLVTQAMEDSLQNLCCAHGTCGHYTCTQGEALYEWEQYERMAGRIE